MLLTVNQFSDVSRQVSNYGDKYVAAAVAIFDFWAQPDTKYQGFLSGWHVDQKQLKLFWSEIQDGCLF